MTRDIANSVHMRDQGIYSGMEWHLRRVAITLAMWTLGVSPLKFF